jgi:hypothetical protein
VPNVSGQVYENYTSYSETDVPANRIVVFNDTRVDIQVLDLDETVYLVNDYGVNYFENFTMECDMYLQSGVLNPRAFSGGVGNTSGNWAGESDGAGLRVRHTNTNRFQVGLVIMENSGQTIFTYEFLNDSARWVFPRMIKDGTNITVIWFSDRARTNKITRHTHILALNDKYRYAYGVRSDNVGLGGRTLSFDSYRLIFDVNNITTTMVSNVFGAGFNNSLNPYIELHWEHSLVNVDNFEINHSSNGVDFSRLALTPNTNYTHNNLVNGSRHWYRIRSTFRHNGNWFNCNNL